MVSDRSDSMIPMVIPTDAFGCSAEGLSNNVFALTGPAGHGHMPPIMCTGPHTIGAPNTTGVQICYVMPLPTELSANTIKDAIQGCYMLLGFWNKFLSGPHSSADCNVQTVYHSLINWWCATCTDNSTGSTHTAIAAMSAASPVANAKLTAWIN